MRIGAQRQWKTSSVPASSVSILSPNYAFLCGLSIPSIKLAAISLIQQWQLINHILCFESCKCPLLHTIKDRHLLKVIVLVESNSSVSIWKINGKQFKIYTDLIFGWQYVFWFENKHELQWGQKLTVYWHQW